MSETKWTPGPWSVDGTTDDVCIDVVAGPDGPRFSLVLHCGSNPDDAHLIAAAPELYEFIAGLVDHRWLDHAAARKLLAKARGE